MRQPPDGRQSGPQDTTPASRSTPKVLDRPTDTDTVTHGRHDCLWVRAAIRTGESDVLAAVLRVHRQAHCPAARRERAREH
jgi:hypothetical protein